MPTNLFGPYDNYDKKNSHVLPALIRKFHEAKITSEPVVLWGDGSPKREFLYSEELADAVIFLMENYNAKEIGEFINIGSGEEITIKELAELISGIIGYKNEIIWDTSYPNGTPRKFLNTSRLNSLGWKPKLSLKQGIQLSYKWFLENYDSIKLKESAS